MKIRAASALLLAAVSPLQATLIFHDSFNYAPVDAQLSSVGSPWELRNSPQIDQAVAGGSLSYPGLETGLGDNSVRFDGTSPGGPSGIASRRLDQIYAIDLAPTLYYSLTLQVTNIAAGDWGGSGNWNTGAFMMGFTQDDAGGLANASVAAPLLIRTGDPANTSLMADSFQAFQLGTGVTAVSPGSRIFDATRTYNPGSTLFLVLSYTFGSGSFDDIARLYVNPVPGSPQSANMPVIEATGVGDVNNSQIQAFFLRNNSVQPRGTVIDDVRVGTAWEDVTPAVPEPSPFGLIIYAATALLTRRSRRPVTKDNRTETCAHD